MASVGPAANQAMDRSRKASSRVRWGAAAFIGALFLLALPSAQAHFEDGPDGHGWLSVHDTADGPDSDKINGLVECLFWVRGHGVTHSNGTIRAHTSGRFGAEQADLGTWAGIPNGDGEYSFLVGPFSLRDTEISSGEPWTIFATMWDDDEHVISSPYFHWSGCEDSNEATDDEVPADCPGNVRVEGMDEGNAILWEYRQNGGEFRVYRNGERIAVVHGDDRSYLDEDVEAGLTYSYRVTFASALPESEGCPEHDVTAVPFFGGPIGMALAMVGCTGALVWMRRRQ